MVNFNTNQTRHLYVATGVGSAVGSLTPGQIMLGGPDKNDNIWFHYKNAEGNLVRSDSINIKNIKYVTKTTAAQLATPLKQVLVKFLPTEINPSMADTVFDITVHIRNLTSYDNSDSLSFVASVAIDSSIDDQVKFHKKLAEAIVLAMPKPVKNVDYLKVYSNGVEVTKAIAMAGTATGSANGVVIAQAPQKYVRGKLSNEPLEFDIEIHVHPNAYMASKGATEEDLPSLITSGELASGNTNFVQSNASIPGYFKVADLEYFAMGERGDYYRGYMYPNDYTPEYLVKTDGSVNYDILNIEFFYQGGAENIQKSPRLIQIAAPAANITTLYNAIDALLNPSSKETNKE